jgi:hypothetical protein
VPVNRAVATLLEVLATGDRADLIIDQQTGAARERKAHKYGTCSANGMSPFDALLAPEGTLHVILQGYALFFALGAES